MDSRLKPLFSISRLGASIIASVFLVAASCNDEGPGVPVDDTPPAAIVDLMALNPTDTSMALRWTAPGDDDTAGTATHYDIRFSTAAISESNWASAEQSAEEPSPQNSGQVQMCTVTGLVPATTYHFAIKSADERLNWSGLSNIVSWATQDSADIIPPAAVSDLLAILPAENSITLDWTAPGDDGTVGTAETYYIRYSEDSISDATWNSAMQVTGPAPKEAGSMESFSVTPLDADTRYFFALKTADEKSNMSPLSNVVSISTTLPAHDILVTEPTDKTIWYIGQHEVPVSWWTGGIGGYVRLQLFKGSTLVAALSDPIPNSGYYAGFSVPSSIPAGIDYRIRVYQDSKFNDYSDYFEIRDRIEISSPTDETIWRAGQQNVVISWNAVDLSGNVSVFLFRGNTPVDTISTTAPASCLFYEYDVPLELAEANDYQVMVYYSDIIYTRSPSFRILSTIFVTSPESSTTWKIGHPASIYWQTGGLGGNVSIVLYKGTDAIRTISPLTPNTGGFQDYTVPADLAPGKDYRVLVSYDEYYYDFSACFSLGHEFVDIDGYAIDLETGEGITGIVVRCKGASVTTDAAGYYNLEDVHYTDTLSAKDEDTPGFNGDYYDAVIRLEGCIADFELDIYMMSALPLINTTDPDQYEGRFIKFFKDITNTDGIYGRPTLFYSWNHWPIKIYNPPLIDHDVDIQAGARGAMDEWESMTGSDLFIEVGDAALADVEIVYFDTLTESTPHHVKLIEENPDGTPARKELRIYQSNSMVPISVYTHLVFAHELGHVLGIKHSENSGHLMLGLAFPLVHHVTEDEARVIKILYNAPTIYDFGIVTEE